MNRRALLQGVLACALAACAKSDGPVEPVWGKQACAHCAMILSDRRFGAQLVTPAGDRLFFDDVGCMVLAIDERGLDAARAWVHDAQTGQWLDARSARYVAGAPSPMKLGFEGRAEGGVGWGELHARVTAKAGREP